MARFDLREKIFAANDIKSEDVTIEEWDVTIQVRGMSGQSRAYFLTHALDPETNRMDMEKMYPELLIATCHDPETGEKLFDASDAAQLNTKSSGALERVAQVAMRLSGLTQNAVTEEAKD